MVRVPQKVRKGRRSAASLAPPNGRTRLLGILGDPLEHSLSPALHSAVLRRLDRNLLYVPLPVPEARLATFLREAGSMGIVGVNVTTPYKELVARRVTARDLETRRTRMVNTVTFTGARGAGGAVGEGTDGAGVLSWLESVGADFEPLLILGGGPTARSVLHRAWMRGWSATLVTRTPEAARRTLAAWPRIVAAGKRPGRGEELARSARPSVIGWDAIDSLSLPRLVISTLPPTVGASIARKRFFTALPPRSLVLDMNYGAGRIGLAEGARKAGCRAATGIGPLLHQAARSLSIWLQEDVPVSLFVHAWAGRTSELRFTR